MMAWPLESGIIFFISFFQTAVTSINDGKYNDFTASEVDVPLEIRPKSTSSAFLNEVWKPTETTLPERENSMAAPQTSLAQWIDKRSTEHYVPEVQAVQSITSVTATSMSFVNSKITTNSVTNRHFHSTPTPMLINRGYLQNSTTHLKRMEESRPLPRPYKMNRSLTKTKTVRSLLNSNKESKVIKELSDMVELSVSAVDTLVTMGLLVTEMDLTPENIDYQFITKITGHGKAMIPVSRIFEDVSKYEEVVKLDEFVTVSRELQLTSSLDETVKNSLNTGSILLTPSLHHSSKEILPRIMVLSESKAHRPGARNLVDLGSTVGFGSNILNMPDYIASSNMFIMEALTSDRSFHDSTFLAEEISSVVPSTDITEPASLVISANTVSLPLLPRSNSVSESLKSSAKGQVNDEGFLEFSKSFVSGFRSAYYKLFGQGDDKIKTNSKYVPNYAPRKLLEKGAEMPNGVLAYVATVMNISSDSEVNTNNLIPDSSSSAPLTTATVATEEIPNGVLAYVSTLMNISSNSEEDPNHLFPDKSSAKYSEQAIMSVTATSNFAIPVFNKSVMKDLVKLRNFMNTQTFDLGNIHNQYLNQTSLEKLQRNTLLLFVVGAIVIQIQLILGFAIIWCCLLRKFRKSVNNKPATISDEHSKVVNFRNSVKLTEVNDEISVAEGQDEGKPDLEGSCTVPKFVTTAL